VWQYRDARDGVVQNVERQAELFAVGDAADDEMSHPFEYIAGQEIYAIERNCLDLGQLGSILFRSQRK